MTGQTRSIRAIRRIELNARGRRKIYFPSRIIGAKDFCKPGTTRAIFGHQGKNTLESKSTHREIQLREGRKEKVSNFTLVLFHYMENKVPLQVGFLSVATAKSC